MYLDLSLKKIVLVSILLLLMAVSISATLAQKVSYFGTTPYTYTISLGIQYGLDTAAYALQQAFRTLFAGFESTPKQDNTAAASSIPVLTYHRIVQDSSDLNNVTITRFKEQMDALKSGGWQTVSLSDFELFLEGKKELPERSFLLTFDDGAKESFYPVDPILGALGYRAVMFVIANSAEQAGIEGSVYYLSPPEIQRMLRSGRWDIGSHSFDGHRPYPVDGVSTSTGIFFADRIWNLSEHRLETEAEFSERVRNDLVYAKEELESEFKVPILSFAFPLGNETGHEGAGNYQEGASTTEAIARSIYSLGFLQLNKETYTYNFPKTASSSHLSDEFLVRRIHVDYDWDGRRLLTILENGLPKQLPYEDDFTFDQGWIGAWGQIDVGRNNFTLSGATDSNASTFLDGTALWDNYSFDAAVNWVRGDFFVLGDVTNASTYDSCAFSPGRVRVLSTKDGMVSQLSDVRDPRIQFGSGVRMGIRVHGDMIECTWNFASIAEAAGRTNRGGIGFQMWDDVPGTSVQITSLIARPFQ